jgi:hypothetical protein
MTWYCEGRLHRVGGPAWVEIHPDGTRSERWYRDDFPDRDDGPACVLVRADGTRVEEWWIRGHQDKRRSHLPPTRGPAGGNHGHDPSQS